jgi:hypothetical protein
MYASEDRDLSRRLALLLLFALSLFLSAFLLFWIEPMFAKMILPMLGGAPSVWNACIVFYQALLLAGYVYAHLLTRWLGIRRQMIFHLVMLFLVLTTLPIGVANGWTPPSSSNPTIWLFLLLLVSIGLPFFVISATAPLLQKWFAWTGHSSAKDPYFLYSASNLGSIIGLLGYPFLIEAFLPLSLQTKTWSASYIFLAAMISGCAILGLKSSRIATGHLDSGPIHDESPSLKVHQRIRWILLAFVPSSLLLGVTNYITTDIAQVPLLWIIPLAIYLITFVLVFAPRSLLPHELMVRAQPFLLLPLALLFFWGFAKTLPWPFIPFHLIAFFITAMVCHGEIARSRPSVHHLTEYYLWISIGGVLGGLFNTLFAPLAFNTLAEYPLMIVFASLLRPLRTSNHEKPYEQWLDIGLPLAAAVMLGMVWLGVGHFMRLENAYQALEMTILVLISCLIGMFCFSFRNRPIRFGLGIGALILVGLLSTGERHVLYKERNFFGTLKVLHDSEGNYRLLFHGTTLHGAQSLDPGRRREPLTYFHSTGPLGQVFSRFAKRLDHGRIAVIGLGTGTTACYGRPGQHWTFYEIDPSVERIARDERYFTFLKDSPAQVSVVVGDARLSLERTSNSFYDLIILDAFSSDSIPVHLLTKEALELYLSKLADGGIMAFHISNRYLNLRRVLADLAHNLDLASLVQDDMNLSEAEEEARKTPSTWGVVARQMSDLGKLPEDLRWKASGGRPQGRLWTDDFSNILSVFIWSPSRRKR